MKTISNITNHKVEFYDIDSKNDNFLSYKLAHIFQDVYVQI